MRRKYRVLLPLTVHTENGAYVQGEVFEKEFSPEDEAENVASGLLEIVPQDYKVVGPRVVLGASPGMTLTCALSQVQEARLIESGQIAPKKRRAKTADRDE